jgi:Transposase IS116/IS110/IS902 family
MGCSALPGARRRRDPGTWARRRVAGDSADHDRHRDMGMPAASTVIMVGTSSTPPCSAQLLSEPGTDRSRCPRAGAGARPVAVRCRLQQHGAGVAQLYRQRRKSVPNHGYECHEDVVGVPEHADKWAWPLDTEVAALDEVLEPLVAATPPELVAQVGVGTAAAGALLVAAGENTSRLRNERCFARLCGAAPLDASSGKQHRHRLSRAGDRHANSALWRIVISRLSHHPTTRRYLQRRLAQGKTKTEAIRCLKRYVARELYHRLPQQPLA